MAKDVQIVPIKTLCLGYTTVEFKKALDFVYALHSTAAPTAVVNISGLNNDDCYFDLDDHDCDDLREAMIALASRDNLLIVQSSGNKTTNPDQPVIDACDRSFGDEDRYTDPDDSAAIARIVIAAGSDQSDARFQSVSGDYGHPIESTNGECVDLFAPAAYIASAFFPLDPGTDDPNEAVCQLSGTSMAAPHVSGVAAMILHEYPDLTVDQLRAFVLNWATRGVLDSSIGTGSPNLLLHWDPSNIMRDGFETGDFVLWVPNP